MPHMIWKGAISFGLVHVPVQLYPATQSEKVGFNLLDKRSMDPIGYKQINKNTGKEVTRDNIVRGFEYQKGKYVVMTDAEIRSANPESTQTVDILAFIEAPEISFLSLDTPYYLAPDRKGEKVYALLRDATEGHRQDRHRERRLAQQAASRGADSGRVRRSRSTRCAGPTKSATSMNSSSPPKTRRKRASRPRNWRWRSASSKT